MWTQPPYNDKNPFTPFIFNLQKNLNSLNYQVILIFWRAWYHTAQVLPTTADGLSCIDPFSVSKHCDVFLWAELRWWQKDPLTVSLMLALKFVSLFFLTITGGIMNFSYICKVTHCLGLQLLFEKVNCKRLNQIGRPAQGFTQRIDDLTGFPSVEWLTSNVYSKDKLPMSI